MPALAPLARIARIVLGLLAALLVALTPAFVAAEPAPLQNIPLVGQESRDAPAIEDFKGRLFVAVTALDEDYSEPEGLNDPIYVTSVGPEGTDIGSWTLVPGLRSPSGPALKVFRKRLYIAARGPDDRVYVASSKDGTAWTDWSAIPNSVATAAPALKVFKNRLYIAVRDEGGSVSITSTRNGRTWGSWTQVPNSETSYAPALTQFEGKLVLGFTVQADAFGGGYIYLTSSGNGKRWSEREQVPDWGVDPETGPLTTRVGPGLTVLDGKLVVSARIGPFDVEDGLYLISNNGDEWNEWEATGRAIEGRANLTTFNDRLYIGTRSWDSTALALYFR